MSKTQQEVLDIINSGEDSAYGLLYEANPKLIKRFEKLDKELLKLLNDVKEHFPDASYYSANSSFCLLLGSSHNEYEQSQEVLAALAGKVMIDGGDF